VINLVADLLSVTSPSIVTSSFMKHGFLKFNDWEKYNAFFPGMCMPISFEKNDAKSIP